VEGERRKEDGLVLQALRTSQYVFSLNVHTFSPSFSWFLFPFSLPLLTNTLTHSPPYVQSLNLNYFNCLASPLAFLHPQATLI
jgi:hypothetical protein